VGIFGSWAIGLKSQKRMAPQVGLEPHPEIPTTNAIVLKFSKKTRKTSTDTGLHDDRDLPQETLKTAQVAVRQYKSSTIFAVAESRINVPPPLTSSSQPRRSQQLLYDTTLIAVELSD
jgi:hypothetical protein